MGFNFPTSPADGTTSNGYTWVAAENKWIVTPGSSSGITQADADIRYVNVTGDTMTGGLKIETTVPTLNLSKLAGGSSAVLVGSTASVPRWSMRLGDNTAESGASVGSDFVLYGCNDAGTIINIPITAKRDTGLITLWGDPTALLGATTKQYVDAADATLTTAVNNRVRYDAAQSLTSAQQKQARANIAVDDGNVIINGDFRVNQGDYVSGAVLTSPAYGHDQWKAGAAGGDYSFTQLKSSTQITIASGKSLIQPIEDVNVTGGSYVLSWTGSAQARAGVNTTTPAGSYAASPLLITGQTAGTAMSVEFNAGTLGTVKLETGAVATPFVMRPYDDELLACQRYLYVYKALSALAGNIAFGGAFSTTQAFHIVPLSVPLRAVGTITFSSPSHFNSTGAAGTGLVSTVLSGTMAASTDMFSVYSTVASGLVVGSASAFQSVSASARITVSARIP